MTECRNERKNGFNNEWMSTIRPFWAKVYWKAIVPATSCGRKSCRSKLQIRRFLHLIQGCARDLVKVPKALTWPSDSLRFLRGRDMLELQRRQKPNRSAQLSWCQQLQNSLASVEQICKVECCIQAINKQIIKIKHPCRLPGQWCIICPLSL